MEILNVSSPSRPVGQSVKASRLSSQFILDFYDVASLLNLAFAKQVVSCERQLHYALRSKATFGKCLMFAEILMGYESQKLSIRLL